MAYYKRTNGSITMRGAGGRFRKTTMQDMGIDNANTNGTVYICNVCSREFVPIVHSGICCGVDDKREKIIEISPAKKEILDKIAAIRAKPFINRVDLEDIKCLHYQLSLVK